MLCSTAKKNTSLIELLPWMVKTVEERENTCFLFSILPWSAPEIYDVQLQVRPIFCKRVVVLRILPRIVEPSRETVSIIIYFLL